MWHCAMNYSIKKKKKKKEDYLHLADWSVADDSRREHDNVFMV